MGQQETKRIHQLCKELRREASAVSVKKATRLDKSDQLLIGDKLASIIDSLLRVQAVIDARCSIVIEMYEHLGGKVPTSEN